VATSLLAPGQVAELKCFHPPICLKFVGDDKIAKQHAREIQNAKEFAGVVQREASLQPLRMPPALFPSANLCADAVDKPTTTATGVVVHL